MTIKLIKDMNKQELEESFNKLKLQLGYTNLSKLSEWDNCLFCTDCLNCNDCLDCDNCIKCINCKYCIYCIGLENKRSGYWVLNREVSRELYVAVIDILYS